MVIKTQNWLYMYAVVGKIGSEDLVCLEKAERCGRVMI